MKLLFTLWVLIFLSERRVLQFLKLLLQPGDLLIPPVQLIFSQSISASVDLFLISYQYWTVFRSSSFNSFENISITFSTLRHSS